MKPSIAQIGCGMWGRNIARNLHELGLLAGVADDNAEASGRFAEQFKTPVMTVSEIFSNPDIEGVAIVTAAAAHAELAVAGLNAGKSVFVEKPLALTVPDAEAMAAAARANNKVLMVGHLIRHHPAFKKLLSMVEQGEIGPLRHIRASRIAAGRVRDTESVLYDLCPHDLALVAALTGQAEPVHVHCHGFSHITPGVEDSVTAQLEFPGGITASIQANWINPVKIHNLTVIGTTAALVFDDTKPWAEKLTRFAFETGHNDQGPTLMRGDPEPVAVDAGEPLKDEMQRFANAMMKGVDPLSDADEALYVQHIMARMQDALDKGRPQ